LRKLRLLNKAKRLNDLRVPPGNGLQALKGNRAVQYSIRVNDQARICFIWKDNNAYKVEIFDYH
jgi:toxin HigB-1